MTALVTTNLPLMAGAPDGMKKLRALILDLAVRGRLVHQDPNEISAADLLSKTAQAHQQRSRGKRLSKGAQLDPTASCVDPFPLPDGWASAPLSLLALKLTDGSHNPPRDAGSGIPMLSSQNVLDGRIDFSRPSRFVSKDDFDVEDARTNVAPGDVLLTIVASIGRSAVVPADAPKFVLQRSVAVIQTLLAPSFFSLLLRSPLSLAYFTKHAKGTAQKGIYLGKLGEYVVCVPPLAEQNRIVAKVDELMALCDRLEADQADAEAVHAQLVQALLNSLTQATDAADFRASWQRLSEHFHTLITTEASIDALKQTVLQLAVMGKLVPQIKRDGSAMDLLASIATMGKSKAPVTPAVDSNLPAVPPSWCWIRIADLAHVGTGATPSRTNPAYFDPPEISWVTSGETSQAFVRSTEQKVSPLALNETNLTVYPVGTLVVAMYGQGKTRGQVTELLIEACTNQACAAIQLTCDDSAHRKFVKYFFEKSYDELRSLAAGGAQPNLNLGKIKETLIPLPPLAEQHRIVAKVDELMALCNQLKAQLAEARQQHAQLATVLVEQAVAA